MSIADKLKEKAEVKPQAQSEDDRLITGLLIPVKFQHRGKAVKGYLSIHPDAVYAGRVGVALEVALEEAGGELELNVWEPSSNGGGGNYNKGGYTNNRGGWR